MIKSIVTNIKELKKSSELVKEGEDITQIIQDLKGTLATKQGYGLAAIQIGIPKRVAYIKVNKTELVLVNSKILEKQEKIVFNEGCLSFSGIWVKTDRWNSITFQNGVNGEQKYSVDGLEAIVVQHEIAHFNGQTIFDFKHKAK